MSGKSNKYIDLKSDGRLFPSWILKNFKKSEKYGTKLFSKIKRFGLNFDI